MQPTILSAMAPPKHFTDQKPSDGSAPLSMGCRVAANKMLPAVKVEKKKKNRHEYWHRMIRFGHQHENRPEISCI